MKALARLPRRSARQPIVALLAVAAMAYALTSISATPAATPGLVAAFAFDEGSGSTVSDGSGSGNNGSVANTSWVAGKYGQALSFNGTSSRVTVPDSASLHLSSAMTLEAWVNPATTTAVWRDVIYKGNDNYYLEGTSDRSAGQARGGRSATRYGTSALPVNTWSYLAVSYDRTTIRLYVNGTQVSTLAATGAIATSTNPLSIGSDSLYGQYFQGLIDDVRVYNTALTQAQIQTDMTTPVAPPAPDTSPPSAPGTLTPTAVSGSRIDLGWGRPTDNVGVTGYRVERCQGTRLQQLRPDRHHAGTTTSYSDTGRQRRHQLQLPRTRQRRGRQPRPLHQHRHRDNAGPDTSPPRRRDADARRRSAGAGSISAGGRRPTTSVSPATGSSAARAPAAATSPRSPPRRHHHQLQRHHRPAPAPATATAYAPPTRPATSAATPTPPPRQRPPGHVRRRRRRATLTRDGGQRQP